LKGKCDAQAGDHKNTTDPAGICFTAAVSTAAMMLPHHARATTSMTPLKDQNSSEEEAKNVTVKDGTNIFYKD
jgi:hypothetical protein